MWMDVDGYAGWASGMQWLRAVSKWYGNHIWAHHHVLAVTIYIEIPNYVGYLI